MPGLTETQLKLRDAGIQMKLALEHAIDEDIFRSCINAYVAAARSVTMVMERESAVHQELTAWYKQQTASFATDPLFRFFNDQRVYTIHKGVVRVEQASFAVTNAQWWQQNDPRRGSVAAGRLRVEGEDPPARPGDVIIAGPDVAITWSFVNAAAFFPSGSTNVFRLCEDYFVRLKALVHAWLAKGAELGVNLPAG